MSHKNRFSRVMTADERNGVSIAMWYGVLRHSGWCDPEDIHRPRVGVFHFGSEINLCNYHLGDLAAAAVARLRDRGTVGRAVGLPSPNDAICMGTEAMRWSLVGRELAAYSIQQQVHAYGLDGALALVDCDKTIPGAILGAGLIPERPFVIVHGGTIKPGMHEGEELSIGSAAASYTQLAVGTLDRERRSCVLQHACPGPGGCGMMATSNTMAAALAALGLSPISSASTPAEDPHKVGEVELAVEYLDRMMTEGIGVGTIITKRSVLNAARVVFILGGSTNAVIHLMAIAKVFGVQLTFAELQSLAADTPILGNLKPGGAHLMAALHERTGGMTAVFRYLIETGLLDGSCMTVSGKNLAQTVADAPKIDFTTQDVLLSMEKPLKSRAALHFVIPCDPAEMSVETILDNGPAVPLAPGGAVFKINTVDGSSSFTGRARVFASEAAFVDAVFSGDVQKGTVAVLPFLGPKGAPGCPEILNATAALTGKGIDLDVAIVTDGRLSGVSRGFLVVHVTPEASEGGPIALVQDGDVVTIGRNGGTWLHISAEQLAQRRAGLTLPARQTGFGLLALVQGTIQSCTDGCLWQVPDARK